MLSSRWPPPQVNLTALTWHQAPQKVGISSDFSERAPARAGGAELLIAERPYGTYTRQVFLGETLDADKIAADYAAGVLTLTIPVREAAKPRNIQVTSRDHKQAVTT